MLLPHKLSLCFSITACYMLFSKPLSLHCLLTLFFLFASLRLLLLIEHLTLLYFALLYSISFPTLYKRCRYCPPHLLFISFYLHGLPDSSITPRWDRAETCLKRSQLSLHSILYGPPAKMSGFGNDHRRSSRGDRDRRRERSPDRRDRAVYGRRDDRQGYDDLHAAQYSQQYDQRQRNDEGVRGVYGGRGGYRGSDRGDYSHHDQYSSSRARSSSEMLRDLPDVVPRPTNGGALTLNDLPVKGTMGRSVRIALNHFVVQSLPVVKVQSSVLNVL